jgi:hypothetical protein
MAKKFNPVTEFHVAEAQDEPAQRSPISPERAAEDMEKNAAIVRAAQEKREAIETHAVNWRNAIAAERDANRNRTMDEVLSGESVDEEQSYRNQLGALDTEVEPDGEETVKTPQEQEDTDGSTVITKTVNGVRVSRTVDEWLALATKVENADAYYQEAANKFHERHQQPEVVVDDKAIIRELSKKISLGNEDEAAEATEQLVKIAARAANAEARQQDQQEAGKAVYLAFAKEYQDVMADPVTNAAFLQFEQQVIQENTIFNSDPVLNFDARLRFIGEKMRTWKRGVADVTVKDSKRQELINKKAQITNLNTASQKQTTREERPLSELDARNAAVQGMFSSRKKKAF